MPSDMVKIAETFCVDQRSRATGRHRRLKVALEIWTKPWHGARVT